MILLISPAKKMQTVQSPHKNLFSNISFPEESGQLINSLKEYTPKKLASLMNINASLAELNCQRFSDWTSEINGENGTPAIMAFNGDVYRGINALNFSEADLVFAQNHVRILSGLYGILKPLDLILPYRLEMGTKLTIGKSKNLYEFWRDTLTDSIKEELHSDARKVIINLASKEYSKAIDFKKINAEVITPDFREYKDGKYKFFSVFGKYARGLMLSYVVKNQLLSEEQLKFFDTEGYAYNDLLSDGKSWIFSREYGKK